MTQTPTAAEEALANATNDASLARSIARSAEIEADIAVNPGRYRMFTGVRPTGNMHLGHYFGTMHSWKTIQDAGVETWILVADYQVITDRDGVGPIRERVLSLVTESELHRNPTVKSELEATDGRAMSGLMLTYPVHQATDILFCQANLVPVGKDQLPHLEQARLIAQRFDKRYGRAVKDHPVFRRPEALLSQAPMLLGLDGEKMSKSRGNTIALRMSADETAKALKKAKTDSARVITYDPTNRPEVSNLLMLASLCGAGAPEDIAERIGDGGAGTLKKVTTEAVNEFFSPIRARRAELAANEDYLLEVLGQGNARANEVANRTLDDVRTAMQMNY